MPGPQHEPLMSSQTSVNMGPSEGDSTKRALKVAGFTVLACALIVGQGLTAYFLLSQKSQISALEDNTNELKKDMSNHQSAGSSARMDMHVPMSSMSMMIRENTESKEEPGVQKSCMQQALEAGPDDFRPKCDAQGYFLPMQCTEKPKFCWCVDANGQMISGVPKPGNVNCGGKISGMAHMPALSSALEMKDE